MMEALNILISMEKRLETWALIEKITADKYSQQKMTHKARRHLERHKEFSDALADVRSAIGSAKGTVH